SFYAVTSLVSPYAPASASIMYPSYRLPHGGVILHRGLVNALLCAAAPLANPPCSRRISEFGVFLAQERPRRPVIGHVLLRGHARNGAADHFESQVLQRFGEDKECQTAALNQWSYFAKCAHVAAHVSRECGRCSCPGKSPHGSL